VNGYSKLVIGVLSVTSFTVLSQNVKAEETQKPQRVIVQTTQAKSLEDVSDEVLVKKTSTRDAIVSVEVPTGETLASFMKELKTTAGVVRVEPDHLEYKTYTPDDSSFYLQSHHKNIQSEKAWERTKGDASVVVAVIDDGIDSYHTDLRNKIVDPYDVVNGSPYTVTRGEHGTHVSGIIGGTMDNTFAGAGVAPNTSIMPLDVFTGDSAYSSDVISAIYRAVDHGAAIINMSLGSYNYSSLYQSAINYAHDHNVVVIAAAGNDATSRHHYPSSYNHVVSVASTTQSDSASYFSNYGIDIDVSAPGSYIYSTLPYNSFGSMSGTSMASPVVAGVAALVKAHEPTLTNDEIVTRLETTGDDLGSSGWDMEFGYGRVNAASALLIKEYQELNVDDVTDQMTSVTGEIPYSVEDATIRIENQDGQVVGDQSGLAEGYFSIGIPKQKGNQNLFIQLEDAKGNKSPRQAISVIDQTAPELSGVSTVSDRSTSINGKTEMYADVRVKKNGVTIGQTSTEEKTDFTIPIARQSAGTNLILSVTDQAGNTKQQTIRVLDKTAPAAAKVAMFSDAMTTLSAVAEKNSTVVVMNGSKTIGQGTSSSTAFSIRVPKQKAGTKLKVYVYDQVKQKSPATDVTVVDRTAPLTPTVNKVTTRSTNVSGKSEAKATVYVYVGTKKIGSGTVDTKGNYSVKIKSLKKGTTVTVYAVDAAKNKSKSKVMKVL